MMISKLVHLRDGGKHKRTESLRNSVFATLGNQLGSPLCNAGQLGLDSIREEMQMPLSRIGRAVLSLGGKYPAKEVSANLHRLKKVYRNRTSHRHDLRGAQEARRRLQTIRSKGLFAVAS
jgi:hypothetical protein